MGWKSSIVVRLWARMTIGPNWRNTMQEPPGTKKNAWRWGWNICLLKNSDTLERRQNSRRRHSRSEYVCEEVVHRSVELVVNKIDDTLPAKLANSKLIQERKRKVMWYSVPGDGAVSWDTAKKRRLNLFSGTGPGHSESNQQWLKPFSNWSVTKRYLIGTFWHALPEPTPTTQTALVIVWESPRLHQFSQNATVSCLNSQRESHHFYVERSQALVDPEPSDLIARFLVQLIMICLCHVVCFGVKQHSKDSDGKFHSRSVKGLQEVKSTMNDFSADFQLLVSKSGDLQTRQGPMNVSLWAKVRWS